MGSKQQPLPGGRSGEDLREEWLRIGRQELKWREEAQQITKAIDDAHKEVLSLRAKESRMRWDLSREESRERMLRMKDGVDGYMAWRQREDEGFKELSRAQAAARLKEKLEASAWMQRMRREARDYSMEEDRAREQHDIRSFQEFSRLQKELAADHRAASREWQELRRNHRAEDKEALAFSALRQKSIENRDRRTERMLELTQAMRDVDTEKQKLLSILGRESRIRSKSPVSERARRMTTAQAQRVTPAVMY